MANPERLMFYFSSFPPLQFFTSSMARISLYTGWIVMQATSRSWWCGEGSRGSSLTLAVGKKTYNVNGKPVQVVQNVLSRPSLFDRTVQVQSVDDILGRKTVKLLWLNVQHDLFYSEQKHSPSAYVHKVVRYYPLDYISSPEIGFLKAMQGKVNKARTKLILRFLGSDEVEPSTKQSYGSILKDLQLVKAYASGILVPKDYIWPVSTDNYLNNKQATQQVLIQSDDTSVLSQFSNIKPCRRLLTIKEKISDAPKVSVDEVKKHADGVVADTDLQQLPHGRHVRRGRDARRQPLRLCFRPEERVPGPSVRLLCRADSRGGDLRGRDGCGRPDDRFSGDCHQIHECFDINGDQAIQPVQPGSLIGLVEGAGPPAEAPAPALNVNDVVDPPLPPVATADSDSPTSAKSGSSANSAHLGYSLVGLFLLRTLLSM
ncbi:hypothetical protein SAY87_029928 [Trapa incisa]|uniref:glycerophosphodiester phosphodiesterase n=1 Tax=Trapa incisa TaxID=236973 RepID=A0AAN7KBV8_9MYRT|nr:hypothetical protein SAY87_029928 [Trapa incisa]